MPVQTFNESFLGNAQVPNTGSRSGASPSGPGASAKGTPRAVDQADGTANPRADGTTKTAGPRTVPGGKSSIPKTVDKFKDGAV